MTRPRHPKDEKRNRIITLRMNEKEYSFISEQAEKLHTPVAVYARSMLLEQTPTITHKIVADIDELKTLTTEFGRIGNNLNQIARYFNTGGLRSLAMEDEIHECIFQLFELRKEVLRMAGEFHGSTKTYRK